MEEFINRKAETDKLWQAVKSNYNVSIIFSHDGIGKSCFIEHFISTFFKDNAIVIKNKELDFENNIEKYYFADKICEAIISKSETNFITKIIGNICSTKVTQNIEISYKWFGLTFEINEKFRVLQDVVIRLLKNNKDKLIIYIDNVNKIDYQSMVFINQIIDQTSNVFFILEFNLGEKEQFPTKLIQYFDENLIRYEYIKLEKLSKAHAQRVMQNNNVSNISYIIESYDNFDGNLKELILKNKNNIEKYFELDNDENFLLQFIDLTNGELTYDEIYKIIHNYPGSNNYFMPLHSINEYINAMYNVGLVNFSYSNKPYLTSIGKKNIKINNEYLITEMLINYYIPIIINDKSDLCLRGVKILLPLMTKNADARIKKILPALHKNIIISRCNKKIIDDIYGGIDFNFDNNDVKIELIKLYICFGDYKAALTKIEFLMDNADDTTMVIYATIISHIFSVEDAEKKVLELSNKVTGKEAKSAIFTCLVALYMKIKSSNEVLKYVDNLKKNNKINMTDLNIIQKNISIYYDFDNANKMLNDSLLYFDNHNMTKLSIATKITLATRLAQKGYTKEADEQLKDILNIEYISELDYIYVTNNRIVIQILEGDFNNIKLKDLINNYKFIQDEYTKLLIANNLLIYYCNINNYKEAKKYADELERVGFVKYKFESYLLLTYLNLRYYYQEVNANKIHFFNMQLQKLLDNCIDVENQMYIKSIIEEIELSSESGLYFLSQFNYRPAFLGHWIINNFDY